MTNTEMIIRSIFNTDVRQFDQVCCICGGNRSIDRFTQISKVLSNNFMDYNIMKDKSSRVICDFCRLCLSDDLLKSPKGKRCGLRLYSFLVEKSTFKIIDKNEKEYYLFFYNFTPPFILCFTDSGQKHISFKSAINFVNNPFWVSQENYNLLFDRHQWLPIYQIAKELFNLGISKEELLSCRLRISKLNNWKDYQKITELVKYRNTKQYELIIKCLNKSQGD